MINTLSRIVQIPGYIVLAGLCLLLIPGFIGYWVGKRFGAEHEKAQLVGFGVQVMTMIIALLHLK